MLCLLTHSLFLRALVCVCTVERSVHVYTVYTVGLSGIRTSVCIAFVGVCVRVMHNDRVYIH